MKGWRGFGVREGGLRAWQAVTTAPTVRFQADSLTAASLA